MRKQGIGLPIFLFGLVLLVLAGCGQAALTSTLGVGSTQVSKTDEMVLVYVPQGQFLLQSAEDLSAFEASSFNVVIAKHVDADARPIRRRGSIERGRNLAFCHFA